MIGPWTAHCPPPEGTKRLPYSETLHWATEPYGPDGAYGRLLSYMLVLLPAGWLAVAAFRGRARLTPETSAGGR